MLKLPEGERVAHKRGDDKFFEWSLICGCNIGWGEAYVYVSLTFWLPLCESKALGRVGTAVSRRTCQSRCYPQIGSNPGPRYDAIHT